MADPGSYHHGDLRAALLDAAILEIERSCYEDLSLRKLASAAGVSHGAPYRHFQSREELLLEIAAAGARRLGGLYEVISRKPSTTRDRLKDMCRAYIGLAAEHPQLFRLMFVSEIVKPKRAVLGVWWDSMDQPFALFKDTIAAILGSADQGRTEQAALSIWATIHGLALLRMTGHFSLFEAASRNEEALIDSVLEDIVRIEL